MYYLGVSNSSYSKDAGVDGKSTTNKSIIGEKYEDPNVTASLEQYRPTAQSRNFQTNKE